MAGQPLAQRHRCAVIEEDPHARGLRDRQALSGMFQHSFDLFTGHAGKPLQKIVHRCAVFQIFKQRSHRHARAFEQPRATDLSGDAFHRVTFAPIQHGYKIASNEEDGKG
jgi:hypothetical protein